MARISLAMERRKWDQLKTVCEEIQQDEDLVQLLNKRKYNDSLVGAERVANDDLCSVLTWSWISTRQPNASTE